MAEALHKDRFPLIRGPALVAQLTAAAISVSMAHVFAFCSSVRWGLWNSMMVPSGAFLIVFITRLRML